MKENLVSMRDVVYFLLHNKLNLAAIFDTVGCKATSTFFNDIWIE